MRAFRTPNLIAVVTAAVLSLALQPSTARAAVVYSNLGAGDTFDTTWNQPIMGAYDQDMAQKFTVPAAGPYRLTTIEIPLCHGWVDDASLNVSLAEDANGLPGTNIETVYLPKEAVPANGAPELVTVTFASEPLLQPGATYWVVAAPATATSQAWWYENNIGEYGLAIRSSGPWYWFAVYQAFALRVSGEPANEAPALDVSSAPATSVAGTPLTFTAAASDPEGGAVAFSLTNAPASAAIDPSTGVFTWTPASNGLVEFGVVASDPEGASTSLTVRIDVLPALEIGPASLAKNGRTFTITVSITNRSASIVSNVSVNSATLDGSTSNSPLPLLYGSMKPGMSKQSKLQFKAVVPDDGDQATLTISGACSLGSFFTTQKVTVP